MMQGQDHPIPRHGGEPVCLVWALKGECSATCKRKEQHVRYSRETTAKIHELLDTCDVGYAQ